MKPKRLEITGFKSFIETQVIDFDRLCDGNLFCISGDTGSGKTSILDAMICALYGDSGAKIKKNEEFVNTSCKKATIRLSIELNGKEYTILREIRKGGTATAKLYDENGVTIKDKTSEVNDFVQAEIGLDRKQFTKVVVLKQGEFDAFLDAEKTERTQLIEKLFDLSIYEKAVSLIREEAGRKDEQIKNFDATLSTYEGVDKTALDEIEKYIQAVEKEKDEIVKSKEKNTLELEKLNGIISKYELWKKNQDNIDLVSKEIENNQLVLDNLQKQFDNLQEKGYAYKDFDEVEKKATKEKDALIEGKMKAQEIESKEKEREKLVSEYLTLKQNLQESENKLSELSEKIKVEKVYFGNLSLQDAQEKQKENANNYTLLSNRLSAQNERVKAWQSSKEKKEKASVELQNADAIYTATTKEENLLKGVRDDKEKEYKQAEKEYEQAKLNAQASHIRSSLKVGDICPVCGAVVTSERDEIESEIEKSKEKKEQKQKAFEIAEKEYQNAKTAKSTAISNLSTLQKAFEEREKEEQSLLKSIDCSVNEEKVKSAEKEKDRSDAFVSMLKEYDASKNGMALALKSIKTVQESGLKAREEIDALKKVLKDKFETCSSEEIQKKIDELTKKSEKEREEKAKFDSLQKDTSDKIIIEKTRLEELRRTLENLKIGHTVCAKPDENAILTIKNTILEQENAIASKQKELGEKSSEKATMLRRIEQKEKIEKERRVVQKEYDKLSVITSLCRGRAFTDYVAEIFIASFTLIASDKLREMTLGHYSLSYEEGEFFVKDYLAGGEKRSVKTLSGGERFLASLSLAIAISRRSSETKDYGFFFIDEGFGSLDEKSLSTVCQSLFNLSKDTVVGVITHVKELIERVPTTLLVTKSNGIDGSECKILN